MTLIKQNNRLTRRKLTDEQVLDMCNKYASGEKSQSELASEYGISTAAIRDILVFYTYSEVTSKLNKDVKTAILDRTLNKKRFSKEDVEKLYYGVLRDRKSVSQVAEEIGMTRESAKATLKGRMYSNLKPELTSIEELMLEDLRKISYEVKGHLTEEQVRSIYKEYVESEISKSQLAYKYGVNEVVIRHILSGQSYIHVFDSLSSTERRRIDGALKRKRGVLSSVTPSKLSKADRDFRIFRYILTSKKPYYQIAEEIGVHPSYITLLIKGKRGSLAWDMLNPKEIELVKKISEDNSYRGIAVNIYNGLSK